ncbi:MAG TPA: glycosyltransferase family 2 protein [Mucilaginibacter sp.]|jgi:glycosyltransferase involved in cell wall biosynthesis|nr:glycosyltransferase family 2 protein [Mucilaginibacter sp.]
MALMLAGDQTFTDLKQVQTGRISVIIVTYNAAATLQVCLESIYNQSHKDLEIIVIDGKSTDGTVEILEQNAGKLAFWNSEKDEGVYEAMNKGTKHVTGQWVYFLGADDELLPGFSDIANELIDPDAIYYGNVFAEGKIRLGELTRYQIAKCGPYHQAIIYPASVFKEYNYNTSYKISADFALTLQLCGNRAYHFVYKNYVLANFNHEGISGKNIDHKFQHDKAKLVLNNFGLVTWFRYLVHRFKHRDDPRA